MPITQGLKAIKTESTGWREDRGGGHASGRIVLSVKCMKPTKDKGKGGGRNGTREHGAKGEGGKRGGENKKPW